VSDGPRRELTLQNPQRSADVGARALRPWLEGLLDELAPEASSFTARFTSSREVREINRSFRDKDYATDVLSFPGDETPEGWHLGDVVIALPVARRQAAAAGHPLDRELRGLVLHGVLHCLGHDHETDDGEMEELEAELRGRFLDSPPLER
jgi:probable rRNA maturation factor